MMTFGQVHVFLGINRSAPESVQSNLAFGRIERQYSHSLRMERH
jgi:hypothetical protein